LVRRHCRSACSYVGTRNVRCSCVGKHELNFARACTNCSLEERYILIPVQRHIGFRAFETPRIRLDRNYMTEWSHCARKEHRVEPQVSACIPNCPPFFTNPSQTTKDCGIVSSEPV